METVIRSPQKGVIKRLAHKEGVGHNYSSDMFSLLTQGHRTFAKPVLFWSCLRRRPTPRLERSELEIGDVAAYHGIFHQGVGARVLTLCPICDDSA